MDDQELTNKLIAENLDLFNVYARGIAISLAEDNWDAETRHKFRCDTPDETTPMKEYPIDPSMIVAASALVHAHWVSKDVILNDVYQSLLSHQSDDPFAERMN